jgi:signal transduction histidine kinase/ActR/RegA family two-component response regulator
MLDGFLTLTPCLRAEATTIALLGAAIALLSVSHANNTGFTFQQFSFLNFVPILWAAARFGAIGGVMSASFCVLATVASYSAAYSAGLLVLHLNVNPDVVSVHKLSLLVQSCVGLLLGTAIAQHTHAQVELAVARVKMQEHQARNQLNETLVQTNHALAEINAQLQQANRDKDDLLVREQAARSQAEAANRVKDEFLAVLSHELRTPLNPILGWAKLLQTRTPDEATTKRALGTIERNAKLQAQLIEDLLDVSRILQGKITLNLVPVNLAFVIQAALETVQLSAVAKAIDITFTPLDSALTDPLSKAVSGDSNRLQQVVWNLLANAVKFTPEGGRVTVVLEYKSLEHNPLEQRDSVHTQSADRRGEESAHNGDASSFHRSEDSQSLDYAQITVTDTGKGIDPAFLPHVFEHFRQEDGSTTRTFGGLGLGLAIARHLVELHQGSVEAYSDGEDRGATFIVKLPLLKSGESTPIYAAASEPMTQRSPLAGLQILVVDDEADTRDLLHYILNAEGAIVTVAASAHEAIALLEHTPMDLVISDISMPDVNGYALIRQIRQLPMGAKISAIALTANARDDDRDAAISAGFDAHLAKPVAPTDLVRTVASFNSTSFSRAAR